MSDFQYIDLPNSSYITNKLRKYGINQQIDDNFFLPIIFNQVNVSVVNALRRIFTSEIKNLAFAPDDIRIIVNKSQYHREVLLDRFGFITISMDGLNSLGIDINNGQKLVFMLDDRKGEPLKNTTQSIMNIFIHDHLRVFYQEKELPIVNICPFNSVLLTLNPNESIHVHMTPSFGIGRQHARWQSSVTMYKFATDEDQNPTKGNKIETTSEQQTYNGYKQKTPTSIILTIESIGKFSSINVLFFGLKTLIERLDSLSQEFVQMSTKVTMDINKDVPNLAIFKILEEDHTLGHLVEDACMDTLKQLIKTYIEQQISDSHMQESDRAKQYIQLLSEAIVGYRKTHPLDTFIELIIRLPDLGMDHLSFPQELDNLPIPVRLVVTAIESRLTMCNDIMGELASLMQER